MELRKRRDLPKFILIVVCVILAATSIYFFLQAKRNHKENNVQQETISRMREAIELPNETPVSVTVADKTKLSNKALAAHVENQDEIYIFNQSKRLIIYRPSAKKVVDMLSFADRSELPQVNKQQEESEDR